MNGSITVTTTTGEIDNGTLWRNKTKPPGVIISQEMLIGLEVVTLAVLVILLWTIFSMIIYGCKTRRWRKRPSSSSLSSGAIFVLGILAMVLCLCLPVITVVSFQYSPDNPLFVIKCEEMGDINVAAHVVSSYVVYMFLWRHQRLIYKHSYVKPSIKPWVNWLSRFFCVLITLSAGVLLLFYILSMSFEDVPGGCALKPNSSNSFIDTKHRRALVVPVAVINFFVIILFIYPAARVKFDPQIEDDLDMNRRESLRQRYPTLSYVQKWAHSVTRKAHRSNTSPIELAVRRGVTSCAVVVVIDLVSALVTQTAIPLGTPLAVSMTIYNVALLLKVFALIFTYSFGFKPLKVCIPHCPKPHTRGGNSMRRGSSVNVELVNPSEPPMQK